MHQDDAKHHAVWGASHTVEVMSALRVIAPQSSLSEIGQHLPLGRRA